MFAIPETNLLLMEGLDGRWFFMEETGKGLRPLRVEGLLEWVGTFSSYDQALRWLMAEAGDQKVTVEDEPGS